MFKITNDKTIHLTRGDVANILFSATTSSETDHVFSDGDLIRFRVFRKNDCKNVVLQKDIIVDTDTSNVTIFLAKEDTKIGDIINRPIDYWYEIELNPDTSPRTIIGYDDNGPKIFRLYPEGSDMV